MFETLKTQQKQFGFPDIEKERGEFERVASSYGVDADTLLFLAGEEGVLQDLGEDLWSKLENTDSNRFGVGAWDEVREASESQEVKREWKTLKEKMERGESLDAPIIAVVEGVPHLVSGNTRLMVARALGITPKVLLFEYKHDRTDEATD